jgi:hypothetical protein
MQQKPSTGLDVAAGPAYLGKSPSKQLVKRAVVVPNINAEETPHNRAERLGTEDAHCCEIISHKPKFVCESVVIYEHRTQYGDQGAKAQEDSLAASGGRQ